MLYKALDLIKLFPVSNDSSNASLAVAKSPNWNEDEPLPSWASELILDF